MDIKIIVATHKNYQMPEEPLYLPVQAGAACHDRLSYTGDDSGDNISAKNDIYCELTALYWAWKNLPADVVGLCHYRRYFREPGKNRVVAKGTQDQEPGKNQVLAEDTQNREAGKNSILTESTLKELLKETSVILPKKRNYFIETGESQFVHAHGAENLEALKQVLSKNGLAYRKAFDSSMSRTDGHRFNMMIMKREPLEAYCSWLFGVLFETEKQMGAVPPRMMGFLAERLMDAWIEAENIPYRELPVYHTEKENWLKKGGSFLLRKIRGR